MEFVNNDNNVLNTLFINRDCTELTINGKIYGIIRVGFFTESEGKFETDEYIIKYSKKSLYLYDRQHNLLSTYKFSRAVFSVLPNVENSILSGRFILKKNYNIELYNTGKGYYIINNDTREEVVDIQGSGSDTVYITENNNNLSIGKIRNSKWNGIPIYKLVS